MASRAWTLAPAILACIGLSLPPTAAEAGMRTGTWANGMVAGPYGVGWYGPNGSYVPAHGYGYGGGWAHHGYGYYPGYYGSYPAYYGGYGGYPGYYYYRKRRSNTGAALAAGLIGGIALGAILANASARAHSPCPIVHRRVVGPTGRVFVRHVRAC